MRCLEWAPSAAPPHINVGSGSLPIDYQFSPPQPFAALISRKRLSPGSWCSRQSDNREKKAQEMMSFGPFGALIRFALVPVPLPLHYAHRFRDRKSFSRDYANTPNGWTAEGRHDSDERNEAKWKRNGRKMKMKSGNKKRESRHRLVSALCKMI